MELKSFRELLLKKVENHQNPYLQDLIISVKDDLIADRVLESLEKMAQPSAAMGRAANSAVTAFAGQLTGSDVEQIRDALAHHVSHYRGALNAGNRDVADKHLNRIIPMMHLIGRAQRHTNGRLALDYRSTTPWESNYTTLERHDHNGKLKEGTKDLGRRPKRTRENSARGVPDYRYLEMAPHHAHADTKNLSKPDSGYPFEELQVGSQDQIDSGKAWLHLEDVGAVNEYKPHPFDKHPIHEHADYSEHHKARTPEDKEKFAQDLINWKTSEHHKQWIGSQKERFQKDPEGYKARGTKKPGHFWEGLKLAESPAHAKKPAGVQEAQPKTPDTGLDVAALPDALKQKYANTQAPKLEQPAAPAPAPAQPATPAAAPKVDGGGQDDILAHIKSTLTPDHIKKMTPEMKKILKIKD